MRVASCKLGSRPGQPLLKVGRDEVGIGRRAREKARLHGASHHPRRFDERDAELEAAITGIGLEAMSTDTMMVDASVSQAVAEAALVVADRLR